MPCGQLLLLFKNTLPETLRLNVGVAVAVFVGAGVCEAVTVAVDVGIGVPEAVTVAVDVGIGVPEAVAVEVAVAVAVHVGVCDAVAVGVAVSSAGASTAAATNGPALVGVVIAAADGSDGKCNQQEGNQGSPGQDGTVIRGHDSSSYGNPISAVNQK